MHARHGFVAVICAAPLLLLSRPASSDDITVNITNDGTEAILVTVYDRSRHSKALIVSQRINGFATIPVTLPQDAGGNGNLAWSAVTVDALKRKCGRGDLLGLVASSSVAVHADADCTALEQARPAAG